MSAVEQERSSIGIYADTKADFDRLKPGGLSADEFVSALLEHWEGEP